MGTSDDLLQACAEMIASDGIAKLSLRKLAEQVGIKAPSIYEHFESKDALLAEVRRSAATELRKSLVAHGRGSSPRARLLGMAKGYLAFARKQPALFALFFMESPSARASLAETIEPDSPYAVLLARVQEVVGESTADVEILCFGIWALVHGAAVLRQTHLQDFSAVIETGTRQSLEAMLDGWLKRAPSAQAAPRRRPPARGQ